MAHTTLQCGEENLFIYLFIFCLTLRLALTTSRLTLPPPVFLHERKKGEREYAHLF
jgi:hypothetical protein